MKEPSQLDSWNEAIDILPAAIPVHGHLDEGGS